MPIEITPKESSGVDRHVQVSVPVETVRDAEDTAARRYASSVRLPGFRPGKAPAAMVRKKFADAIRQEALEALVRDAYKEVVEKEDLKVASQPHVHVSSAESRPFPTSKWPSSSSRFAISARRGLPSKTSRCRATW